MSLRESEKNEAIYKNIDSKDFKHLDSMDCHDSVFAESRNNKIADSNGLPPFVFLVYSSYLWGVVNQHRRANKIKLLTQEFAKYRR